MQLKLLAIIAISFLYLPTLSAGEQDIIKDAVTRGDFARCQDLQYDNNKALCKAMIKKDKSYCYDIRQDDDYIAYCKARTDKDKSSCYDIKDLKYREQCQNDVDR